MSSNENGSVAKQVANLEGKLKRKLFLEGSRPTAADTKAFYDLLGAGNLPLFRWVKNMASFSEKERSEWGARFTPLAPSGGKAEEPEPALKADAGSHEEAKEAAEDSVAKSTILLDVKVWEESTNLENLSTRIKAVEKEGLVWGAHKLIPVAFGVKKLQMLLVIEDSKVSAEDIEDIIQGGFEEEVQSIDIVAWNKI